MTCDLMCVMFVLLLTHYKITCTNCPGVTSWLEGQNLDCIQNALYLYDHWKFVHPTQSRYTNRILPERGLVCKMYCTRAPIQYKDVVLPV